MTLVCFALLLQEPMVTDSKENLVCWSFKRVPVSLVDSHIFLIDRNPAIFHIQMLCGHLFLVLVVWAGESLLGLRSYVS